MGKMHRAPIFITGTGTGVGKTLLTALLAAALTIGAKSPIPNLPWKGVDEA